MKIISVVLILTLISCSSNQTNTLEKQFITKFSLINCDDGNNELCSSYIFFKQNDGLIGMTTLNQLHGLYKKMFVEKFHSWDQFLNDVINQKIVISDLRYIRDQYHSFKINNQIRIFIEENNVEKLKNKFCRKKDSKSYWVQNDAISYTVLYYLFLNNHLIFFDDVVGNYIAINTATTRIP